MTDREYAASQVERPSTLTVEPPGSLSAFAASEIRRRILAGVYPLGSRLDQRTLAKELGISVSPVREALRLLQAEGLVENLPNRGAFVATLSRSELAELVMLRDLLDPIAMSAGVERVDATSLQLLELLVREMEESVAAGQYGKLSPLSRRFQFTIYELSGLPVLVGVISGLRDRFTTYGRLCVHSPEYVRRSLEDHAAILAACRDRDGKRAGEVMRRHLQLASEYLDEHLPRETEGTGDL
jgi:DNA-binding GntR family transcriptional regulator